MTNHDHPFFTAIYRRIVRWEDSGSVGAARTEVAAHLSGRTLVIGLGPGEDLHHLPKSVTAVVAVEPSASMRAAAATNIARCRDSGMPVDVAAATGEDLPYADNSADSALLAFVLCTVTDPAAVLAEVRRVVRPGGTVAVLEHVAAHRRSFSWFCQRLVAWFWPRVAGGCHPDRDTMQALRAAGFSTEGLRRTTLVNLPPVAPALMGTVEVPA